MSRFAILVSHVPVVTTGLLQKVVPGMLLLGAVLEIHEYLVVFSLPFNMRGTVAISDVSAHITELAESEAEHLDENEQVYTKG